MSSIDAASVNRRDFFRLSGVGLSGLLLHPSGQALASGATHSDLTILYDASQCIGCRACERACKEHNDLPAPSEANSELSATAWNLIVARKGVDLDDQPFFNYQCMHCTDAACVMGCPSGALSIDERGFVSFDQGQCIGCGYCTQFCPFGIPQLGGVNVITGEARAAKCTFCQDKIEANTGGPSCAEACPSGALTWGERGTLLAEAKSRVSELKTEGQVAEVDGKRQIFCPGAKHKWVGTLEYGGYRIRSKTGDPLRFRLDPEQGYVFAGGQGSVTQPDGKIVNLR